MGQVQDWIGAEQTIPQVSQSDHRQERVLAPPATAFRAWSFRLRRVSLLRASFLSELFLFMVFPF
jgi:hypothetical protein